MDLNAGLLIGRIRGIAIRAHWSWLLICGLVLWNLQSRVLPDLAPGWSLGERWLGGISAAAMFFLSVLLHELSHAFVALHYGMRVPSITLFVFGGVSTIDGEMQTPGQEFRIAIAGPAMSMALGIMLGAAAYVLPGDAGEVAFYLGGVNVVLGLFNLLPGFPLDGGRVLRSIVWATSHDLTKSTRIAARVGTSMAWGIVALGVFVSISTQSLIGLWYVLIGLFLKSASDSAYGQLLIERALEGVRVRDVMRDAPEPVDPWSNLMRVVEDRVIGRGERAVFVGGGGRVLGLFTIADLAVIPRERLATMTAREAMVPAERIATVLPDAPLLGATHAMTERDVHQLPVVEDGRMVGLLTRGDVLQQIEMRQRLARITKVN